MIRRLLIANRGEIALRVIRACRELGVESVAVFSDADATAPHVRGADAAVRIGPAAATESYLSIPRILNAAAEMGADAVHPGYGFLSENPALSQGCEERGLTFVGPPAAVMLRMGSKIGAREVAVAAGVPVVPGAVPVSQRDEDLHAAVAAVGFPALLKAASGGGGKGMRVVRTPQEVADAIAAARQESGRAFGKDSLYVERLIERPRHIEVQVFGDRHGSVVHLFERDCSLQRRHQKVIEEAPAPAVTAAMGERLARAAVAVAREAGYVNAGTVEFLVDGSGDDAEFFFLELNMRLQVEHPVTEAITGLDLVQLQLRVASGERLPFGQNEVSRTGHAIECRVYAEDARRLLPQAGRLLRYREPAGPGLRIDSGVVEGQVVTVHYDPLLAKVIAYGDTRDEAHARLLDALRAYEILGIRHNLSFLAAVLSHPAVTGARTYTRFIEDNLDALAADPPDEARRAAMAIAAFVAGGERPAVTPEDGKPWADPWDTIGPLDW